MVNMLDPQSHHNPPPKRSSSSGTLNMIPPRNIHTEKQFMPRGCSNGCSLNWFTPSELFQFSQLSILPTFKLISHKNANDVHQKLNLVWVWNKKLIEEQFQSSPKLVEIWTMLRCIFCSTFCDCNFNWWWVMALTSSKWVYLNIDFGVQFDLECQGQSPSKAIGILTKVFCTYGLHLVTLA